MSNALPKSIAYLKPLFRRLRADAADGLDEERDNSDVEFYLSQRVRGLTTANAVQTLLEDRAALSRWLQSRASHPAHYLIGYLSLADDPRAVAALLAKKARSEPRPKQAPERLGRLKMTTPSGFKLHRVKGALVFFEDADEPKCAAVALAIPHATAERYSRSWEETGAHAKSVSFGAIVGRRFLLGGKPNYLLPLEKGTVHFAIDAGASGIDESHFSAAMSTVSIE